ncbi:uncharacterized protein [Battus philenor]|uniref:uncharacterized protein n=1 Tax=Battus philenor TaxID=42288 RepID=UPI0035CFD431
MSPLHSLSAEAADYDCPGAFIHRQRACSFQLWFKFVHAKDIPVKLDMTLLRSINDLHPILGFVFANSSPTFALCFVSVLIFAGTEVNAFAIRSVYNATKETPQDLAVDESLHLEVKHDFKRPNGVYVSTSEKRIDPPITSSDEDIRNVETISSSPHEVTTVGINMNAMNPISELIPATGSPSSAVNHSRMFSNLKVNRSLHDSFKAISKKVLFSKSQNRNKTETESFESTEVDNSMASSVENIKKRPNGNFDETTTVFDDLITGIDVTLSEDSLPNSTNQYNIHLKEFTTSTTDSDYEVTNANMPAWRRYMGIDRKRTTTPRKYPVSTQKYDTKGSAETRFAIDDSVITDVISLTKVTKDFTSSTKSMFKSDTSSTSNYHDMPTTQQIKVLTKMTVPKPRVESVSSRRAGFLNYSSKSKTMETTAASDVPEITTNVDNTTPAIDNNEESHTSNSLAGVLGAQRYLDEDAIKEEMLQETSLKNNEEIAKQSEERVNSTSTPLAASNHITTDTTTHDTEETTHSEVTDHDGSFNVKPIQDKGKSTVMYTVNPNYRPMKKIEVLPPKQFVRDPDDNSWRNESISSLGIVFKPKNSSKPLTQVLKNKTETEWRDMMFRDSKSDVPDLRERLERIAQKRKTKKKKADLFGNIIYSDYEETNSSEENTSTQNTVPSSTVTSTLQDITTTYVPTETVSEEATTTTGISTITSTAVTSTETVTELTTDTAASLTTTQPAVTTKRVTLTKEKVEKKVKYDSSIIEKGKKYFNIFDYYDVSEEDESEYLELAKLELKKFSSPNYITEPPVTSPPPHAQYQFSTHLAHYVPDRRPTVQYFPPRITQRPKYNRYDSDFENKIKSNAKIAAPKYAPTPVLNAADISLGKYYPRLPDESNHSNQGKHHPFSPDIETIFKPNYYNRNLYHTEPPQLTTEPRTTYGVTDHEGYNRASYVIKNYKDFLNQASKDYDYDRDADLTPYTQSPLRPITIADLVAQEKERVKSNNNFNYDYDAKFRKDVLQRFVDNFNHNEARYTGNFPILFNNTVTHDHSGYGEVASSRAFLKGLYKPSDTSLGYARRVPYDPRCDNVTVELAPAYELYYVPEHEDNEELEPKSIGAK